MADDKSEKKDHLDSWDDASRLGREGDMPDAWPDSEESLDDIGLSQETASDIEDIYLDEMDEDDLKD